MIGRVFWLLSRPSAQGGITLLLPAIAFACVTALLGIVLGGAQTFWTYTDEFGFLYQALAVIALVLLLVPLASLCGAAARLSVRRRDDRLAVLRLLGATGSQVAVIAVLEAAAVALVGAFAGILLSYAASPLIGLIHFRGEPLGAGAALHPVAALCVVLGVTLIAIASSVISLRRVAISPLGVALKQGAPKLSWLRLLIAVVVIGGGALMIGNLGVFDPAFVSPVLVIGIIFGGTLAVLGVVGPWLIGVLGRGKARRAQDPQGLLAARLILDSPKAAWRQVSGVAMASFMAVFAGSGMAMMGSVDEADLAQPSMDPSAVFLPADIRTGILITVIGAFLTVACSVGVGQAAHILDRRDVIRSLDMLGTPLETQDSARHGSVMLPLLLAALGSAGVAAVVTLPILGIAIIFAPLSVGIVFASIAAGILLVKAGLTATRPLLRSVAAAV